MLYGEGKALQLQHLADNVYYLPGPSNVGLIVGQRQQALLIDTGVGQRSGRRLLRIIQEQGLHLAAILNTHCHGDHVGGNAYLVERTGAQVYAPVHDAVVLQYPVWGTMCMFGGAEPIAEMAAPRFNPQPCAVDVTVTEGSIEIAGIAVRIVPLPGHTGSHTGYIANEVFFTGDILAGREELGNAAFSYAYSITKRLQSLESLRKYTCKYYVLGHGRAESNVRDLIECNIAQIHDTLDFIRAYLDRGCAEASDLLAALCVHHHIEIRNLRQYFLYYPTLHSFLSHLINCGEVEYQIRDHRLLWCKAERS